MPQNWVASPTIDGCTWLWQCSDLLLALARNKFVLPANLSTWASILSELTEMVDISQSTPEGDWTGNA